MNSSAACVHTLTSAPSPMKSWSLVLLRVVIGPPPAEAQPAGCQLQGWSGLACIPSLFLAEEICFIFPLVFALLVLRIKIHCLGLMSNCLE